VDPDFDIAEMGFDAYLTKPVGDDELRDTVDELLTLSEYDEQVRERFAIAEKLVALESEKPGQELATNETYQSLKERSAELDERTSETVGDMAPETFEKAISGIGDAQENESDGQ
jgi:DNA-binding response OmpR family regulator